MLAVEQNVFQISATDIVRLSEKVAELRLLSCNKTKITNTKMTVRKLGSLE